MRRWLAVSLLFALFLPETAEARKPRTTLRVHTEANERDGQVFAARIRSSRTEREVVIEKVPAISERDVVGFSSYPATDGSFGVLFQLDDHGTLALDTLSVDRRGTTLYVFLNGRLVSELEIDRRVRDGKLFIASGLAAKDLAVMTKDWPRRATRRR